MSDERLCEIETASAATISPDLVVSVSEDSDTIKFAGVEKQPCKDVKTKQIYETETASCAPATKLESSGNILVPSRGSTPVAFKFMQPKRKLLDPSQVLTVEEEVPVITLSKSNKGFNFEKCDLIRFYRIFHLVSRKSQSSKKKL